MKRLNIILILILCNFLFIQCKPDQQEFAKKGKSTKGRLAFKQEVITESSLDYIFMMYFFTNDTLSVHDLHKHKIWKDTTISLEEKIQKWDIIENNIGKFYSAEIFVDYDTYARHKEGDVLNIVYLPENPHEAIIKNDPNKISKVIK